MSRYGALLGLAAAVVTAVLLQVGLLAVLPLPGATPDLVLVLAAGVAIARGPSAGAVTGFAGGLLLDLVPPATHAAGLQALVLTLAGYAAGWLGDARLRNGARSLLVGGLAALATAATVGLTSLLGAPWPGTASTALVVLTAAAYATALAVLVVPAGSWLATRAAAVPRTSWSSW